MKSTVQVYIYTYIYKYIIDHCSILQTPDGGSNQLVAPIFCFSDPPPTHAMLLTCVAVVPNDRGFARFHWIVAGRSGPATIWS